MMKLKEYVERIQKLGAKIHKHQQNEVDNSLVVVFRSKATL